jgi:hypothetical protein
VLGCGEIARGLNDAPIHHVRGNAGHVTGGKVLRLQVARVDIGNAAPDGPGFTARGI